LKEVDGEVVVCVVGSISANAEPWPRRRPLGLTTESKKKKKKKKKKLAGLPGGPGFGPPRPYI